MSKKEKALEKLRQNPKNVRFEELAEILIGLGFVEKPGKGSHSKFVYGVHVLVIPKRKPFLKPIYITLALQVIDEILDADE